jgi:PcfJ-like protein
MSWSERYVQDHKRQTDCAIHRASAQLASDPLTFKKFQETLTYARKRAPRLFEAPVSDGRHLGVDALVNLSRFRGAHIRPAIDWAGTSSSWRPAVSSLAHHLICDYKVPVFLASSWYANDSTADKKRGWFVAHSRGASFRSLNLPIAMTRKMEHIFLASQDHLPIEHAIRRAELLAFGAPKEFVTAIMSTRMATDLRHNEFWRTVWTFLIANAADLDPMQIAPMIDYIQAVRHDRTQDGMIEFGSPQPAFSMKGRTVHSMLRMMREWHRSLGTGSTSLSWVRSPFEPLLFEEPSRDGSEMTRRWQMMELINSAQLRREGTALHHCVASYADRCYRGISSIWSLRFWQAKKINHVLTVEVDPRRRAVIQARGRANRAASGKSLRLLQDWAVRERLQMTI